MTEPQDLVTALTDITTHEVSLVKRGANAKIFCLAKSAAENAPILEACINTVSKSEEALASQGLEISDAERIAIRALESIENPSESVLAARSALTGVNKVADQTTTPAPDNADAQGKLEAVVKAAEERIAKAEADRAKAEERIGALEAVIKADREERRKAEFLAKAEQLPALPIAKEDLASLLQQVADLDPELAAKLEALLSGANEAMEKSLGVAGSALPGSVAKSAMEEANERAAKLAIEKGITRSVAFAQIIKSDRELRNRIREEESN